MAKTKISEYDSTAANNTDIDGINIAEGCAPSGLNNSLRAIMSHLKDMNIGSTITMLNTTEEDTDGGRANKIIFKGEQSGGEESVLAEIQASHDGTADDQKGDLIFKTNDGSDGSSPTEAMRIDSDQRLFFVRADTLAEITMDANRSSVDQSIGRYRFFWNGTEVAKIEGMAGPDTTNKDDGQLRFQTTESGSSIAEHMRITSTGKILIGSTDYTTTAQQGKLKVRNDVDYSSTEFEDNATLLLQNENNNNSANIVFHSNNSGGSSKRSAIVGGNINSNISGIGFYGDVGNKTTSTKPDFIIKSNGDVFFHGITGRATGSTGHISITEQNNNRSFVEIASTTTTATTLVQIRNPNGTVGTIQTSGSSTSFNTSSDYRLKENVTDISDGITRLKQLQPRRFNFIADADTTVDGFIAHEAATVVPEAISGTKDELEVWEEGEELPDGVSVGDNKLDDNGNTIPLMQGIDQSKIVPLLTAALQEAIAKIEALETRVAALEE